MIISGLIYVKKNAPRLALEFGEILHYLESACGEVKSADRDEDDSGKCFVKNRFRKLADMEKFLKKRKCNRNPIWLPPPNIQEHEHESPAVKKSIQKTIKTENHYWRQMLIWVSSVQENNFCTFSVNILFGNLGGATWRFPQSGHPLRCTLFCEGQIAAFKGQIGPKSEKIARKIDQKITPKNVEKCREN